MPKSYWLRLGRRTEGPLALDEVRRRAMRGRLTPGHSVSQDGHTWMAALRCTEIFRDDGSPIPPGSEAGAMALEPLEADANVAWDAGAVAGSVQAAIPAVIASAADRMVAAWPAHLSCAITLGVACGLPMARDAEGPLWWWNVVRLWDLGGAGLVTAAVAWAIVAVAALATSVAIWLGAGPGRLIVLMSSAIVSMVLATAAWSSGMAGGAWTAAQCALIPASAWALVRSQSRPRVPARAVPGTRHGTDGGIIAYGALGATSAILGIVSILVRDGAAAMAVALLMLVGGAGAIASVIRWRVAGPDEWTTIIPCGVAVMACGALVCDGLAAMADTPAPPAWGTRFAVLDAVRVTVVLLC
ncbi:MAG: hypothetical protein FGM37_06460, partial [Phycisphaerales bacterium]|nr:hypothetical protein [Phycisphaerales bacterium]